MALLEGGGHKTLNSAIKAATYQNERPRTLLGMHDVDVFLAHVLAERWGTPVDARWRNAIEATRRAILAGAKQQISPGSAEREGFEPSRRLYTP